MKTPKRFIAGAICPSCHEIDKLVMWSEETIPYRECMACGFTDMFDATKEKPTPLIELNTHVIPQKAIINKGEVKTIQFFPNPKLTKKSH